jgi:protein SCO1/2
VAVVGGLLAAAGIGGLLPWPGRPGLPFPVASPAPFDLTRHDGTRFSSRALAGRPYAIFFGFTNCPDVCPTTLLVMSNHLRALGDKADRLRVLFVSVDPERDTAEQLARYLSSFDPRIVGLTGAAEEIETAARAYHVRVRKVPTGSAGYTLDHTATVFLFDAAGRLSGTMSHDEPEAGQLARLQRLIAQ